MAAAEIGSFPPGVKRFFLLGAPIIALIIYWILPNTYTDIHNQVLPFNPHAKACLAVVVWMVLWTGSDSGDFASSHSALSPIRDR